MRVEILYTGGTLGMVDTPQGLAPGADLEGWLHRLLSGTELDRGVGLVTFDHLIDSANATPEDWQHIVDELWARHDDADAFVVLHGTDTMAYAAAALSYALTGFDKPVVLTGAQYPLGVVGTDAAPNVTGALRAAMAGQSFGVAIFFGHKLLRGTRVTKTSSWAFQGFGSPSVPELARTGAPWQWTAPGPRGCGWDSPRPYRRCDIAVLDLAPGITADRLAAMIDPRPEAVVLRAFGVGNAPSDEPGLVDVIAATIADGVPVVVTSQCHQADVLLGHYEAGWELARAGAIGSEDMTLEAVYAKLVFLLSQGLGAEEVAHWMGTSIAGELTVRS
ncbi:asparaginase [Acidipropionibacterium jensenii]|uniref:Asparaginase n=2 Tax=Acidipropionibacterium jensenii TaxID=1749 RepID=A0A3Q9UI61_9ACTN|nr:asparaginase [Acidipropionibacterium jensenii]AZZ38793.1 asparaginase [Acidipropionibacterium jensenii]QCV88181.1 asparaginase [Acidipropionibacterium jensenii]